MSEQTQARLLLLLTAAMIVKVTSGNPTVQSSRPNVLLILADDLGYGDLGCFGNTTLRTPNVDKLASQGVKLTHNLAAASLCTPSRAAFLTGRYPIRSGMASHHVFRVFPLTACAGGLPASELTIGEVAKAAGYRTAYLGKWHLGWSTDRADPDHPHPLNQGFDYFYGVPMSNMPDFGQHSQHVFVNLFPHVIFQIILIFVLVFISFSLLIRQQYLDPCPGILVVVLSGMVCGYLLFPVYNMKLLNSFMFRNYDIVEQPIDLPTVTRKLVAESEQFLQARDKDNAPFLLLVSWLHVHSAIATATRFRGQSAHGPYGDAVAEMDWGVGQLLDMLDRYNMADNTLVYFSSDHGGHPDMMDLEGRVVGGFNGLLRGSKGEGSTEGSVRVATVMKWSGHFPAGSTINEPVSMMDILPTLAEVMGVRLTLNDTTGLVTAASDHLRINLDVSESNSGHDQTDSIHGKKSFHHGETSGHTKDTSGDTKNNFGDKKDTSGDTTDTSVSVDNSSGHVRGGCSHVIDGMSLVSLLKGEEKVSPHEFLFYYCGNTVHAVTYRPRSGNTVWKLMYREPKPDQANLLEACATALYLSPPKLFNLTAEPSGSTPLRVEDHPGTLQTINTALQEHQGSIQHVPSQFSLRSLLWIPWKQPCCAFPRCARQDQKFEGRWLQHQ